MNRFKYLIVGGGMTADAAVKGIKRQDAAAEVGVLSAEPDPPYNRPPLTKGLWKGKSLDTIWRKTEARGARLLLNRRATAVEPQRRQVVDEQGEVYTYEKLLLATGGTPRRMAPQTAPVVYYRTLQDYRQLRELCAQRQHFAVIGGGFIGTELAAALAMNGKQVTMIFPEAEIGARVFPAELARFLSGYYREKGVTLIPGVGVTDVRAKDERREVRLEDGRTLAVDVVVAGLGIEPDTRLATAAGLQTDNGIVVDPYLQTSQADIYAAGDVANFHSPLLGKRLRVEHEDNANAMGEAAGQCMAGARTPYSYLPYFYSDLFDLGYEALGETNPRYETVVHWDERYRKGVIFYLSRGRVSGIVFWNVWKRIAAGRELLAQPGPFDQTRLEQWAREAAPG